MEISLTEYGDGFRLQMESISKDFLVSNIDNTKALVGYKMKIGDLSDSSIYSEEGFVDFVYNSKDDLLDVLSKVVGVDVIGERSYKIEVTRGGTTTINVVDIDGNPVHAMIVGKKPVELNFTMDLIGLVDPFTHDIPKDSSSVVNEQYVLVDSIVLNYEISDVVVGELKSSFEKDLRLLNKSNGFIFRFGKFTDSQIKQMIS